MPRRGIRGVRPLTRGVFDRDSHAMKLRHASKGLKSPMAHEVFDIVRDFILCWPPHAGACAIAVLPHSDTCSDSRWTRNGGTPVIDEVMLICGK